MATNLDELTDNSIIASAEKKAKKAKKKTTKAKKSASSKTKKAVNKKNTKKSTKTNLIQEVQESQETVIDSAIIPGSEVKAEQVSKKRTIRSIKTSAKVDESNEDTKAVEVKAPKKKRTLRLNMNFARSEENNQPVDTSVNQNSSFFYEPSVFERFNLSVSNVDEIESPEDDVTISNTSNSAERANNKLEDDYLTEDSEDHIDSIRKFIENTVGNWYEEDSDNEKAENVLNKSIPTQTGNAKSGIKSFARAASPIFKKFSYEESSIVNDIENEINNEIVASDVINTVNNVSVDPIETPLDNIVPEVQVSADPVGVATPVIEVDTNVLTDAQVDGTDEVINVATDNSNNTNNVLHLDDEQIEKLLENEKNEQNNNENEQPTSDDSEKSEDTVSNEKVDETIDYENSNSLDNLIEFAEKEDLTDVEEFSYGTDFNYDDIKEEQQKETYNDESFSIESYFGLDHLTDEDFEDDSDAIEEDEIEDLKIGVQEPAKPAEEKDEDKKENSEFSTITKLLESFNESINTLSNKISVLEEENKTLLSNARAINSVADLKVEQPAVEENAIEPEIVNAAPTQENSELEISDEELMEFLANEDSNDVQEQEAETPVAEETSTEEKDEDQLVEDLLSEALLSEESNMDEDLKNSLLSEVLSTEEELGSDTTVETDDKIDSDFSKVLECLTKAISDLEESNESKTSDPQTTTQNEVDFTPVELQGAEVVEEAGKSINILINKDDIFSIQILNESYEIVADFDGISVLSENIHVSTPKSNFYVKIGEKYIEIHNNKKDFTVYTNFDDIEFANAINNVGFAKKNNRIELNIKEAFKISAVNNRVELSMLNKTIASIKDTPVTQIDEGSICDNKTLLISEETQKVYLPYTIADVMNKLKYNDEYKSVQDVVDKEYTVPLSTFKMPIISRFREAYRFMRTKENSSVYAAVDLAVELMFNSNLNPAVIRAAKDLKELNIYLDCLYENEVEKFDCFKIVYKVLPKIK